MSYVKNSLNTNKNAQCDNLWSDKIASSLSEPEKLLYRSNLLGKDKRITNFGGGNTSAKTQATDPLSGEMVDVLWVKGSGGDLGSMDIDGFATLYQHKLEALKPIYDRNKDEDAMVSLLNHCTFNLNPRAASIDTPLHAYLPYRHVDHMHPDSIIALAACDKGEELTREIFVGEIGWLKWKRPGFVLGLQLEEFAKSNPDKKGVILENHGLFTWADDAYCCYQQTLNTINQSQIWFDEYHKGKAIFGGTKYQSLSATKRYEYAEKIMPVIRGLVSKDDYLIGEFVDSEKILEFVNSMDFERLAAMGTSCPDHFLRTKIFPLVVKFDPIASNIDELIGSLCESISNYQRMYQDYYDRCRHDNSPAIRNKNPVIFLIAGIGMFSFANNKMTARIAAEFYINAVNVMRGADSAGNYVSLPEQEAFDIEYWLLEEAKLQRLPKAKPLAGQIALITGAAGGIGKASAEKLLEQGACVMLTDIDGEGLVQLSSDLSQVFGSDNVSAYPADITQEKEIVALLGETCRKFGGLDILVSNAGIASSAAIEETSLELWQKNISILTTGYFLVSREAFKVFQKQELNGSVVFIASKNGLVASPNASAYCTAKAAEIQLARTLALEGASIGIRVNVVNPDAVLQGSKIWTGSWKQERADAYKMDPEDLQAHYRNRSLLKRNVYPKDIANAVYFLVSNESKKSTGNIINVDAGHAPSFTR